MALLRLYELCQPWQITCMTNVWYSSKTYSWYLSKSIGILGLQNSMMHLTRTSLTICWCTKFQAITKGYHLIREYTQIICKSAPPVCYYPLTHNCETQRKKGAKARKYKQSTVETTPSLSCYTISFFSVTYSCPQVVRETNITDYCSQCTHETATFQTWPTFDSDIIPTS